VRPNQTLFSKRSSWTRALAEGRKKNPPVAKKGKADQPFKQSPFKHGPENRALQGKGAVTAETPKMRRRAHVSKKGVLVHGGDQQLCMTSDSTGRWSTEVIDLYRFAKRAGVVHHHTGMKNSELDGLVRPKANDRRRPDRHHHDRSIYAPWP